MSNAYGSLSLPIGGFYSTALETSVTRGTHRSEAAPASRNLGYSERLSLWPVRSVVNSPHLNNGRKYTTKHAGPYRQINPDEAYVDRQNGFYA